MEFGLNKNSKIYLLEELKINHPFSTFLRCMASLDELEYISRSSWLQLYYPDFLRTLHQFVD
jgi:hypothetical protein